jgi:hypothetical protein
MTKWAGFLALLFLLMPIFSNAADSSNTAAPVLVELFTSEGCSSCPPADRLLVDLDRTQPVQGADLIVLSEHVDYWNSLGWRDPWSSAFFSDRQSAYSDHFGLRSVYTPQLVVNGEAQASGNDWTEAKRECQKASTEQKIPVHISAISLEGSDTLHAHIEADALPESVHKADLYVVVALNHADSEVKAGENNGRKLTHVAVVESMKKVGSLSREKGFAEDVKLKLNSKVDPANLRLIAFVQEPGPGKVLGASLEQVQK